MAIAGAGFFKPPPGDVGTSIHIPTTLTTALNSYTGLTTITNVLSAKTKASTAAIATNISFSNYIKILNLGNTTLSPLTNTIPSAYSVDDILPASTVLPWDSALVYGINTVVSYQGNYYISLQDNNQSKVPTTEATFWKIDFTLYSFSNALSFNVNALLFGNTSDPSIFCQVYGTADAYLTQSNVLINSTTSTEITSLTFSNLTGGMNNLTTGSLNQFTSNFAEVAKDMKNLGFLIALDRTQQFGLPSELVRRVADVTGITIPSLNDALLLNGFEQAEIDAINSGLTTALTATQEKLLYEVLTTITDDDFKTVLSLLQIKDNPQIVRMSDLLNVVKLFPNSYQYLLTPLPSGLENLFINGTTINNNLVLNLEDNPIVTYIGQPNLYDYPTLKLILPADQAAAVKGITKALEQIQDIANSTLPGLAKALTTVQDNTGLDKVIALTTPVPANIITFYQQSLGNGSGVGNTLVLSDFLGTLSLSLFPTNVNTVTTNLTAIDNANGLDTYNNGITNLINLLDGDYGLPLETNIIPSGPGAGTYTSWNNALDTLIPAIETAITGVTSAYPAQSTAMNNAWASMVAEIARETANQKLAQIDLTNTTPMDQSLILAWVQGLHDYALDTNTNALLTNVANTSTLGGQCVIASLREGVNIDTLENDAGVSVPTNLPENL